MHYYPFRAWDLEAQNCFGSNNDRQQLPNIFLQLMDVISHGNCLIPYASNFAVSMSAVSELINNSQPGYATSSQHYQLHRRLINCSLTPITSFVVNELFKIFQDQR